MGVCWRWRVVEGFGNPSTRCHPHVWETESLWRGGFVWCDLIFFSQLSFLFCLICILCFFPSLSISFPPTPPFFLNSLLSAKDYSLTLKCPSPTSLPPTAFFFHPLFLIACAREQRKEKERIPSLCEIQERERERKAGRQSCQPGRVRPNPQEHAARLEHTRFTTSIVLAVPCHVAVVLPVLHGTSLQKCCFWHLLPWGNEMGVRDGPKPPVVPA